MADENIAIALILTATVLVAFAWIVTSTRNITRRSDRKLVELKDKVTGLEHRASAIQRDVHELIAVAERKAEQAYVEKRINGLIGLVKNRTD